MSFEVLGWYTSYLMLIFLQYLYYCKQRLIVCFVTGGKCYKRNGSEVDLGPDSSVFLESWFVWDLGFYRFWDQRAGSFTCLLEDGIFEYQGLSCTPLG